jgi:hypothetical protein
MSIDPPNKLWTLSWLTKQTNVQINGTKPNHMKLSQTEPNEPIKQNQMKLKNQMKLNQTKTNKLLFFYTNSNTKCVANCNPNKHDVRTANQRKGQHTESNTRVKKTHRDKNKSYTVTCHKITSPKQIILSCKITIIHSHFLKTNEANLNCLLTIKAKSNSHMLHRISTWPPKPTNHVLLIKPTN